VGFVGPTSPSSDPRGMAAFMERVRELGYVDGQNLVIEARWADRGNFGPGDTHTLHRAR
jgi:hypothetical protein